MSGFSTYKQWQAIEEQAKMLGFRLGSPRGSGWTMGEHSDLVALYPADESLPIYNREADLFTGTFGQVQSFLAGWIRSREYDRMLRMTDDKRRRKFEAAELARQAEQKKREEQKKLVAVLQATDAENSSKKK